MSVIEIIQEEQASSFRQRWSHYFVLIFGVVGFFIGLNLRDSALNSTALYVNSEAGIRASYPANWLIDEVGNYIFRVRDVSLSGYKTTIQVAAQPVSVNSSSRTVFDALTLNRAQVFANYNVLSETPYDLPNDITATAMTYTYVVSDPNPFLQGIPVVVTGLDILTIQRGQAIIITFLADARNYDEYLPIFNQFLSNLEF